MRKNRTKHEAKKPRLAKRALALCFALIFVCSCLLPAFANSGENQLTDLAQETVVEQQDEQQPTDPVLLNEGGTDPTEGGEQQPTEPEQPKNEDSTKQQGNEQTKPEEPKPEETKPEGTTGETKPEEQPKNEGTTGETKPEGTTEEPKTEETKPEEPKQPTTNTTGDTIEQGKATYTYRFWPDKIDAFELEAINDDVKSGTSLNDAAQLRVNMVPCTVLTVMTNANLRDYQANVQQPTKPGYEFAVWYTVDGTTEDEFSFEQSLNFEESKTIDVFAKWNELKAVKSDALSNGGMTVEAKVGPMANVKSVALAEPSQSDAETLRNSIDKQLYDQSYMVAIFDITPKDKDGMDVEPQNGESVNVEISGLDFSAGDNVWVYHLTNSGRVETLSATVTSDGGVEFTTKSFSPFAVVKLTEGMVGFGTEDDRLATADLQNYEMKVGESKTLYGEGQSQYYSSHTWESSKPNVVTVTGNDYSATVEAKSAGTAVITHSYSGRVFSYSETTTITVTEDTSSYPLYVYAKMSDTVRDQLKKAAEEAGEKLEINAHGWFTLGMVGAVQGIGNPENSNAGQSGNPKLKSGTQYDKAVGSLENIQRYGKNAQVDLSYVKWNHGSVTSNGKTETFGLTTAAGATDYGEDYRRTWHLDGYIESLSAVVVNYYIDRDGTLTKIKESSKTHLGTPGKTYTLTEEENLPSIPYGGRTYTRTRMNPTTGTQTFPDSGKVATINLYYGLEGGTDTMTPDTPYINVEKRFTGISEAQIPDNFKVHIGSHTLTKNAAQINTETDGTVVLRWKLDGVDVRNHRITETGTTVPGYKLGTVIGIGDSVEVKANAYTVTRDDWIQSCKNSNFKVTVKEENGQNYFMVISTTGSNTYSNTNIILSANKLSASQRAAVAKYLSDSAPGVFKNNTTNKFYSIKDNTNFTIAGAGVTYDKVAGTVRIQATKDWNQVLKLHCETDEGNNPEVKIVNPYTPATLDIRITKDLTTHDTSKKFTFKVTGDGLGNEEKRTLVDENGNKLERVNGFEMTHGKTVTLKNVEAGMHVNVMELDRYDYDVTATNYSTSAVPNSKGEKTFDYEVELRDGKLVLVDSTNKNVVDDNHIVVTNTPATTSLTVTKATKKDGAEDHSNTKDFEFTLTLGSNSKGVTWTKGTTESGTVNGMSCGFKLKGDESITFYGINVNDDVTVTEMDYTSQHYTTTVDGTLGHEKTIESATLKLNQTNGTTVNFVNAYTTPKLPSMTIQKKVTGEFGDRDKSFTFSVTLTKGNADITGEFFTGENGANVTNLKSFTLKHNQSVTLYEIPVGTTITVTETDANDYKTSATGHKNSIKTSGARTFTYKVEEQNGEAVLVSLGEDRETFAGTAITVTNNFDGTPDTGVLLDTLPYLILLAVAVAGGVLVVVRKRKHRDE